MLNHNIYEYLKHIQNTKPIILNITNEVTINDVANIESLIGASPIMSNNLDDCISLLKDVKAIVINLGTLNPLHIYIANHLLPKAKLQNIPIIIDIVGYGINKTRNDVFDKLLKYATLVKGNGSEILSLYYQQFMSKGIDTLIDTKSKDYSNIIKQLAHKFHCHIMMTGITDYVSDGIDIFINNYGHYMMTKIVGTGCILNGVIATFIDPKKIFASIKAALLFFTISAHMASKNIDSLSTFKKKWHFNMENFHLLKEEK